MLGEDYSNNNNVSSFVALFELNLAYLSKIWSEYLYVFLHSYLVGFPHGVLCAVICIYMTKHIYTKILVFRFGVHMPFLEAVKVHGLDDELLVNEIFCHS